MSTHRFADVLAFLRKSYREANDLLADRDDLWTMLPLAEQLDTYFEKGRRFLSHIDDKAHRNAMNTYIRWISRHELMRVVQHLKVMARAQSPQEFLQAVLGFEAGIAGLMTLSASHAQCSQISHICEEFNRERKVAMSELANSLQEAGMLSLSQTRSTIPLPMVS